MPHLTPLARQLKQCQECMKSESKDTHLMTCSKCKRAHYCSKECQTAHWPTHKPICKINSENRTAVKAEPTPAGGITPPAADVELISKKWVQQYRLLLSITLCHALELRHEPNNALTHILVIEMEPAFTPLKIPRKDHDIRRAFKLENIFVCAFEELLEDAMPQLKTSWEMNRDKIKEMRSKTPGAVGCPALLLIIKSAHIARLVPLGADVRCDELPPWEPAWLKNFKRSVERGFDASLCDA